ncbi:hypothetical protein K470DRAFT_222643 [Piedraia hortae CBS 480.64]|uniref:SGF29 C-terminal domain-containing protein n=1 Tax=Piedraia hortae CBS 480.64 TaxID=1314780 RepID=A0A6A7BRW1_9PEZI|nr:hypothetical protein K470DRAFT_222643 [Piedraia hortae CBS 480.64]
MSSSNRIRAHNSRDTDVERRLWKEIQDKAIEADSLMNRSNENGAQIIHLEERQAQLIKDGNPASAIIDEQLESLYRANLQITKSIEEIVRGREGVNLLERINVLAGLRESSEEQHVSSQSGRGANNAKRKAIRSGGKLISTIEDDTPSPRISLGPASRLGVKERPSRAGSLPGTREVSVKVEEAESVGSSADAAAVSKNVPVNSRSNRLVLKVGEIVFCRHDAKNYDIKKGEPPEGEGILCRVTNVIGEGKQRRYEVQDADNSGDPPPPQRASVNQLIQIPDSGKGLPDLPKGKGVLAQYPDTTTFYKAVVSEAWRGSVKGDVLVKLLFQDDQEVRGVERRFVLTERQ